MKVRMFLPLGGSFTSKKQQLWVLVLKNSSKLDIHIEIHVDFDIKKYVENSTRASGKFHVQCGFSFVGKIHMECGLLIDQILR